jgi:hypothetical protein
MKSKYFFVVGLLVAFLSGAAPSLFPSEGCRNWDARGFWKLNAQNNAQNFLIEMHLDQSGNTITGRFSCNLDGGSVAGTLGAASLNFQITWSQGSTSTFAGSIAPDGRIKGTWFSGSYTKTTGTWSGDRAMTCADPLYNPIHRLKIAPTTAPPANTNPPKVIHITGHAKAPAGSNPTIAASPSVVTIPAGQSKGTTMLSWDGGSDHPYAEIWVKVGDQDEKFVVEQGKGTRQVTVRPGKTYLYILTDSGQRLATVMVTTQQ